MPPSTGFALSAPFLYWSTEIADIDNADLLKFGKKEEPLNNLVYWSCDYMELSDEDFFKYK